MNAGMLKTRETMRLDASQSSSKMNTLREEISIEESSLEALDRVIKKQTALITELERGRKEFAPTQTDLRMIANITLSVEGSALKLVMDELSERAVSTCTEAMHSNFDKYAKIAGPVIGVHEIKKSRQAADRIASMLVEDGIPAFEVPYFAALVYAHCFIAHEEDLVERINYSMGYLNSRQESFRIVQKKVLDARKQLQEISAPAPEEAISEAGLKKRGAEL